MGIKTAKGKKIIPKIFICCLVILCLLLPCGSSNGRDRQLVRVAYFNIGDYYTEDSSGAVNSYDSEFLRAVEDYANVKFEFVDCGTWNNALNLLGEGRVDLIGTAQWTPERAKLYAYCRESYGYTVGELATLESNHIVYQDYAVIGQAKIGCVQGYIRLPELKARFKLHNISPEIITYPGEEALEGALKNGEVDIIAANSHTIKNAWKLVDKFSYSSMYFITWKGNEQLVQKLDNAFTRLKLERPYFRGRLNNKYFPEIGLIPLNKKEMDMIREHGYYTVYLDENVKPLTWLDKKSNVMEGAFAEAVRQIGGFTGLKIEVKPKSLKQGYQSDREIYSTMLLPDFPGKWLNDAGFTEAILEEPFNLFQRTNESYNLDMEDYSVAIVAHSDEMKSYLMERFPNFKVNFYTTPGECIKAVEEKKADFTFLNIQVANSVLLEQNIENIKEMPIRPVNVGMGLRFKGANKVLLASAVNKGIAYLDKDKIAKAMFLAGLEATPEITMRSLFRDHRNLMLGLIVLGVFILLGCAVLVTYAQVMRKERDKVRQANRDRSEFFARMSHDMRTPMNGILGMSYLSEQENDAHVLRDNMAKVKDSGLYLLGLINDSLDLQKIENGNLHLEKQVIQGKKLVDSIVNMVKHSAERKQIEFKVKNVNNDLDFYFSVDAQRVRQIFVNLLSNAVRYTPNGGCIQLIIESTAIEGNIVHEKIKVMDTGVGISKDFLQSKLFTPYTREQNAASGKYAGSGLGLSIAKSLIELMGGRIEVASELGEGTVFTVYLDFERVDASQVKQDAAAKNILSAEDLKILQGKYVLLCEDHPINAEIIKKLLERVGCTVVVATDGKKGVEVFAGSGINEIDAVLMDIRMPVMDGIAAAKEIRTMGRTDGVSVPIVALSANAYKEDVEKSIAAGMNAHIAKPIEPEVLYNTLLDFLN